MTKSELIGGGFAPNAANLGTGSMQPGIEYAKARALADQIIAIKTKMENTLNSIEPQVKKLGVAYVSDASRKYQQSLTAMKNKVLEALDEQLKLMNKAIETTAEDFEAWDRKREGSIQG